MNQKSITFKLLTSQTIVSFVMLLGLVIFFNYLYGKNKLYDVDQTLISVSQNFELKKDYQDISLYEIKNKNIIGLNNKNLITEIVEEIEEKGTNFFDFEEDNRIYVFNINNSQYVLLYDLDNISDSMEDINEVLVVFSLIIFVLMLVSSYILIKQSLKPIQNTITEVEIIKAHKDFSKTLQTIPSNDEVAKLINTFNTMLGDIDTTIKQIKQFSDDASHELKTPITVIQGEIDLALNSDRDKNYYKHTLQKIEKQNDNLQNIINGLLILSKTQNQIENTTHELDFIVMECYEKLLPKANNKNISLEIESIESCEVYSNDTLVQVLLTNLIENAIKYSHNDSKVIISLKNSKYPILKVQDFGIGIDKNSLENIFDRFYRSKDVIDNKYDGIGLGLSIVQKIVKLYDWKIEIKSEIGSGSTFCVEFIRTKI